MASFDQKLRTLYRKDCSSRWRETGEYRPDETLWNRYSYRRWCNQQSSRYQRSSRGICTGNQEAEIMVEVLQDIMQEIPWILPIWYCFFALKKQALSQVKTSVLTVA